MSNSTFFIKNQLPYDLEKYRNADIRLSIYQLGAEINALYHYSSLAFYAGIQPSVIFFVSYKERNVKKNRIMEEILYRWKNLLLVMMIKKLIF